MEGNEAYHTKVMYIFGAVFAFSFLYLIFSDSDSDSNYKVNVTQFVSADKGMDLKRVGDLLAESKDAKDFETRLNKPGNLVNNLDLDQDGKVDYVNVQEWEEGAVRGFVLTTELANKEVQEVARIKIAKAGEKDADVEIQGNENVYGNNQYHHYRSSGGFGTGLMMGYLFSSHRPYSSPWGYGNYPRGYGRYSTVGSNTYNSGRSSGKWQSGSSSKVPGTVNSPYKGRSAKSVKAPLKNPTASQKSYQARNPTKKTRSGGFGRRSTPSRRSYGRSGGWGK